MATFLWSPYDRPPMRVRRNPQASLYQPVREPDAWGWDDTFNPNAQVMPLGDATSTAAEAMAALDRAGPRGAAALGALAGFIFASSRITGALIGGGLGYLGGRFVVNLASKALAVVSAANQVEKAVTS